MNVQLQKKSSDGVSEYKILIAGVSLKLTAVNNILLSTKFWY